jgi:hypothetical protein
MDQFTDSAAKLVPLLVLLLVIGGVLIGAALLLRGRIMRDAGITGPRRRAVAGPAGDRFLAGDLVSVLGKSFQITSRVLLPDQATIWCCLQGDEAEARLEFPTDLSRAISYPGQGEFTGAEPFPASLTREEGAYARQGDPVAVDDGWTLARYQGPAERALALESLRGKTTLWRGKQIPPEGIQLISEK